MQCYYYDAIYTANSRIYITYSMAASKRAMPAPDIIATGYSMHEGCDLRTSSLEFFLVEVSTHTVHMLYIDT